MKMIHLTMVLAKKVSISSDPANVLFSYPNACLSNICSMNMRSFFDCSKNAISYKVKNSRPFFERTRAYLLPCYHLTSQLPHDSCLSRYPDFEYPDAVTFVSYVAAYLRSVCSFRVRCAAWGGIQQHFIMRLSSAGSFLFSSLLFTWSRHRLFVQYTQRQAVCQDLL